jgi:hypothetical protein
VKLTGDSPPTEQELEEVFAQIGGAPGPVAAQAAPAEQIPVSASAPPTEQPGIIQQTFDQYSKPLPTRSPLSKEYWTENVPQSLGRIVPQAVTGMVAVPYQAAKRFTDPVYNALAGKQDLGAAASDLFNAPKYAAQDFAMGVQDFVGGPLGLSPNRTAKEAWSDPAAAALAVSPLAVRGGQAVAGAMPKNVAQGLTQKSLKFAPGVEPELQAKVAKTVLKEDAIPTVNSYNKFKETIKGLNDEVKGLIEPVADKPITISPDAWTKGIMEKGKLSGEKSIYLNDAAKYVEEFMADHPNLTVGEAQRVKVSINKILEGYERARQAGKSIEGMGREDAMRAIADGLRAEIEKYAPETKAINSRIHEMLVAKPYLKTAANKAENQATFSGRDMVAGGAAGLVTSNPGFGTAVMIASRLARDPRVQGKTAVMLDSFGDLKAKIGKMLSPKEVTSIVEEIEPQVQKLLPPPERGFEMRNPEDVYSPYSAQSAYSPELAARVGTPQLEGRGNPLALPMPERGFEMRSPGEVYSPYSPEFAAQVPTQKALPPGTPKEQFRVPTSLDRLFQIAQSPEGMRLLKERLGREEKYTKLLEELSGATMPPAIDYFPVEQGPKKVQTYQITPSGEVLDVSPKKVQEYRILPSGHVRDLGTKFNPLGQ